jgi:hypothetical protein
MPANLLPELGNFELGRSTYDALLGEGTGGRVAAVDAQFSIEFFVYCKVIG